jgi:hypothetical protein
VLAQVQGAPGHYDPAPYRQRRKQLENREIEAERGRGQDSRELPGVETAPRPVEEGHGAAVLDGHTFGAARRAGGVDQIGEVAFTYRGAGPGLGPGLDRFPIGIEAERAPSPQPKVRPDLTAGDHHRHRGVLDHQLEAWPGIRGIQRYVGPTRLEDAQSSDERVGPAIEA